MRERKTKTHQHYSNTFATHLQRVIKLYHKNNTTSNKQKNGRNEKRKMQLQRISTTVERLI